LKKVNFLKICDALLANADCGVLWHCWGC